MKDILAFSPDQLEQELINLGEQKFRGKQIYHWLHVNLVTSFEEMTNLSQSLREKLALSYFIPTLELVSEQISQSDGTRKYLFRLADGHVVESVLMSYHHGFSVCISSQVGCKMGCVFCASGLDGWARNLSPGELLGQVYRIQSLVGERIANVVVMGTGEPLDNLDNFIIFVKQISNSLGLNISGRNITASTCGLVPQILTLAKEKLAITLAISLHATTQEKRQELMPIANTYSLDELLSACDEYFRITGRRVSFEYSLVSGVNDTDDDAKGLVALLKNRNCHLNLIPINPIKEQEFVRPSRKNAVKFKNNLEKSGINVTIRREMGTDIDGACGQLRRKHL